MARASAQGGLNAYREAIARCYNIDGVFVTVTALVRPRTAGAISSAKALVSKRR